MSSEMRVTDAMVEAALDGLDNAYMDIAKRELQPHDVLWRGFSRIRRMEAMRAALNAALLARTEAGAVCRYCGDSGKVVNVAGAVVGVCAEHGDSVPVADGAVAWSVVRVGNQGAAYDPPNTHRAFTYEKQPGNVDASRLGRATDAAAAASAGDSIDRGLALLKELQAVGFGVFHMGPVAMQAKEAK